MIVIYSDTQKKKEETKNNYNDELSILNSKKTEETKNNYNDELSILNSKKTEIKNVIKQIHALLIEKEIKKTNKYCTSVQINDEVSLYFLSSIGSPNKIKILAVVKDKVFKVLKKTDDLEIDYQFYNGGENAINLLKNDQVIPCWELIQSNANSNKVNIYVENRYTFENGIEKKTQRTIKGFIGRKENYQLSKILENIKMPNNDNEEKNYILYANNCNKVIKTLADTDAYLYTQYNYLSKTEDLWFSCFNCIISIKKELNKWEHYNILVQKVQEQYFYKITKNQHGDKIFNKMANKELKIKELLYNKNGKEGIIADRKALRENNPNQNNKELHQGQKSGDEIQNNEKYEHNKKDRLLFQHCFIYEIEYYDKKTNNLTTNGMQEKYNTKQKQIEKIYEEIPSINFSDENKEKVNHDILKKYLKKPKQDTKLYLDSNKNNNQNTTLDLYGNKDKDNSFFNLSSNEFIYLFVALVLILLLAKILLN